MSVAGSSHSDVPVQPVCPYDPSGKRSPRTDEKLVATSQPRPAKVLVAEKARARHRGDGRGRKNAAAAREHCRAERREVVRGREEARVPRDAAEGIRARVVDGPAADLAVDALRGSDAREGHPAVPAGPEFRVLHPEGNEDALTREFFEWKRGNLAHQLAQHFEPHVRIHEARAGGARERLPVFPFKDLFRRSDIESHRIVCREARAVRQQLFHRHLVPRAPTRCELGDVLRDAVLEADLAVLDERHDARRRRDDLCERGEVENGVEGHRLDGGDEGAMAVGLPEHDLSVPADDQDGAGAFLLRDRLGDHRVDAGEALGRHLHGRGRRDREDSRLNGREDNSGKPRGHGLSAPSAATIARSSSLVR